MKNTAKKSGGFSLVEIVVATGIVGMIAIIATGIFTRFIVIQRYNIAQQAVQEDVRFALELISREVRTGYGSTVTVTDGEGEGISLRNQNGLCVHYRLRQETRQIERAEASLPGTDCPTDDFAPASFAAITSSDTQFRTLRFDVVRTAGNADGLPDKQGMATVIIDAASRRVPDITLSLQSTVTSRQVRIFKPQP